MRSLFLKIFLWFWAATILIIGATLVLTSLIEPYRPIQEDGRQVRRLARDGQRAVQILERGGPDALRDYIEEKERRPGTHFFLLNADSESLTGRRLPADIKDLAGRAGESGVTEFKRLERSLLMAQSMYGHDGRRYVVAGELPYRQRGLSLWRFLNPRFLGLRLFAIFIVSSIFCSWLAWYLTSPVRKLRTATRQFAQGDLKTRVVPALGGRRDELADLGRDFDQMAERIESLITSQGRLLRDISHELRSPLARLNVALELVRQRSGREAGESLDRIEREAARLNELIGQLSTLTLLESGTEGMDRQRVDLSALVKEISDDADFEAGNENRSITSEIAEGIMVGGSGELLRRAIENVVRNAVRYTDEGTAVEISLRRGHVDGTESAVVKVRDHGPGVPEDASAHLLSPFYRVSESRDRRSGGMGIGLAITDRAVRLHGGKVRIENAPDRGLFVEITLPL